MLALALTLLRIILGLLLGSSRISVTVFFYDMGQTRNSSLKINLCCVSLHRFKIAQNGSHHIKKEIQNLQSALYEAEVTQKNM